jgi:hypothetical protein
LSLDPSLPYGAEIRKRLTPHADDFNVFFTLGAAAACNAWMRKCLGFNALLPWHCHLARPDSGYEQWRLNEMMMKRMFLATAAALSLGLATTQAAKADGYGHGGPGPGYGGGYGHDDGWHDRDDREWRGGGGYYPPPPVYYAPPRAYYPPPPVYYAPAPRYYAPPPVYYAPPVITFGFRP